MKGFTAHPSSPPAKGQSALASHSRQQRGSFAPQLADKRRKALNDIAGDETEALW
jgi:hypothetical protein